MWQTLVRSTWFTPGHTSTDAAEGSSVRARRSVGGGHVWGTGWEAEFSIPLLWS